MRLDNMVSKEEKEFVKEYHKRYLASRREIQPCYSHGIINCPFCQPKTQKLKEKKNTYYSPIKFRPCAKCGKLIDDNSWSKYCPKCSKEYNESANALCLLVLFFLILIGIILW
jgi:Zn finger protein HypA/HybF involved in hydrogenase expression